jgi:branched-chain amino acid transport system ATP-binding protein
MVFFEAKGISINFGGVKALNGISFSIKKGEIFSIIGPNGAGKTTIFNCINRYYNLDDGAFIFKGRDISRFNPHKIADAGIARTFQNIELFKNMTVIDNLLLGLHRQRHTSFIQDILFTGAAGRQETHYREKAEEIIELLDLQAYRDKTIANLPYGVQKTVELGRALAMEPELLLLDEPSSGMTTDEGDDLSFWITDIREELGVSILMVEHNMRFVKELSNRVLAMSFGEEIVQGSPDDVLNHPEVLKAYLGEEDAFASY